MWVRSWRSQTLTPPHTLLGHNGGDQPGDHSAGDDPSLQLGRSLDTLRPLRGRFSWVTPVGTSSATIVRETTRPRNLVACWIPYARYGAGLFVGVKWSVSIQRAGLVEYYPDRRDTPSSGDNVRQRQLSEQH